EEREARPQLIKLSRSILTHGMGCNCSLQNFSASLCLSTEDSTATVRTSSLLLPGVPTVPLCSGDKVSGEDSGDALKEKIAPWDIAREMG
uniref:Uncharacterized protein n=1 Tax=Catharus ustulatus TaxID=91951 RepID=A0A8C3UQT4_CATUS